MNIYDISRLAGVSTATVSRVLNDSPRVSEKTREKVHKTIRDAGYTPNAFARGLGLGSMRTVGLMCADVADPYQAQAVSTLEKSLRGLGYGCLLCCTGETAQARRENLSLLLLKRVDAVILISSVFVSEDAKENAYILEAAQEVPVILLNAELDGPHVYCALCDDRKATREAAAYLYSKGAENILYLCHALSFSGRRKLAGFEDALSSAGRPVKSEYIRPCLYGAASIEAVRDMLLSVGRETPFDAVLVSDDKLAVGAMQYAAQRKLRVPGDIQIIGYNNSALCACVSPTLTSVDNRLDPLCARAVETLMDALAGRAAPQRAYFSASLVIRGSTRP